MPLIRSKRKEDVGRNVHTLRKEGKPQKQAVAIALEVARGEDAELPEKGKKKKDNPPRKPRELKKEDSIKSILDFLSDGTRGAAPKKKEEEDEDELLGLFK